MSYVNANSNNMPLGELLLYARIAKKGKDHQILDAVVTMLREHYLCARLPEDIAIKEDLYQYWKRELDYLYKTL